jgi:hypothetical protein
LDIKERGKQDIASRDEVLSDIYKKEDISKQFKLHLLQNKTDEHRQKSIKDLHLMSDRIM